MRAPPRKSVASRTTWSVPDTALTKGPLHYEHSKHCREVEKPWYKRWWIWVIVAILIIALVSGGGDSDEEDTVNEQETTAETTAEQEAEESTEEVAPEPETTEEEPAEETTSETETTTSAPIPAAAQRHEACEPDDGTAQMITGVLDDQSLSVANGQLIRDGNDTWIGVSLLGADGEIDSRSDVWLLRDGGLFAVSGGAKNESWAAEAPGVSMADEYAQGVDRCVVAESLGY